MELLCTSHYANTSYSLDVGNTTLDYPFITEEEKARLLRDFPDRFKEIKTAKSEELVIETKEDKLAKKVIKK